VAGRVGHVHHAVNAGRAVPQAGKAVAGQHLRAAAAVVGDGEDELAAARGQVQVHRGRPGVLGGVGERLAGGEVGGVLDCRGQVLTLGQVGAQGGRHG
jgi:hypothetical protein